MWANDMSIRLAEANRAIQAALAKAHNLAVNISVTVCDADGRVVAFQRMDGAFAEADRASMGKALASARSGRPSGITRGTIENWLIEQAAIEAHREQATLSWAKIAAQKIPPQSARQAVLTQPHGAQCALQ
jgi:uncharacterized protein GlcG (DUF336 family)